MRIVLLTNKSSLFGKKILNSLISEGIKVDAAVIINQPLMYHIKLFNYVKKRVGIAEAVFFSMRKLIHDSRNKPSFFCNGQLFINSFDDTGVPIISTTGTNSEQTENILKELAPDILLLGQQGIIRKNILNVPKVGVLNSHPGILPYYRGIDSDKWAAYFNDFDRIGCSVHWVDKGVDSGKILKSQAYKFYGNETFETLFDRVFDLCVPTLTGVVKSILEDDFPPGESQEIALAKQYFKMPLKLERVAKRNLSKFLSENTFENKGNSTFEYQK